MCFKDFFYLGTLIEALFFFPFRTECTRVWSCSTASATTNGSRRPPSSCFSTRKICLSRRSHAAPWPSAFLSMQVWESIHINVDKSSTSSPTALLRIKISNLILHWCYSEYLLHTLNNLYIKLYFHYEKKLITVCGPEQQNICESLMVLKCWYPNGFRVELETSI